MYRLSKAERGMSSDASFENTSTSFSGLNWYATIGADEVTRYALDECPVPSRLASANPICCGYSVAICPGLTGTDIDCPDATVRVTATGPACGLLTTIANGD